MLVADLERCPVCGSNELGDFIAESTSMRWDDGTDGHKPNVRGPVHAGADTSRKVCRSCGYVLNREGQQ
jgi:hypothetical protein